MKSVLYRPVVLIILLAALIIGGCTAPVKEASPVAPTAPATAVTPAAAAPTNAPAPTAVPAATAGPTARPTLAPGTYVNPVLDRDFPDPDTVKADGWYYAFATNGNGQNIQAVRSQDLVKWEVLPDALPRLPKWAAQDFGWAWAPEVWRPVKDGPFVMYHVARFAISKAGGTQCIGVATSPKPQGPYQPVGDKPLICQVEAGGSIDPASFVDDDGKQYVLWKNDGNSGGGQTFIYVQQVSADGMTLEGQPTKLITADEAWEGVLVEGPTLVKHDGKYHLFYSANAFNTPRYVTGYAVADKLLGPYEKIPQPFLKTNVGAGIVGPGGQDVVVGPKGDDWLLFHSWSATGYRFMDLAPLHWKDGEAITPELSRAAQPAP